MGLLKKIFWPDHPDVREVQKDEKDIVQRSAQRSDQSDSLDALWNGLQSEVEAYKSTDWESIYENRPIDASSDFDWNLGNCLQDLGMFQPLQSRVPAEISTGMPLNVKRSVVRDYWASVTYDAIEELRKFVKNRPQITSTRSQKRNGYLIDYYWYADRFCLFQLRCLIADTQVTRATWNEAAGDVAKYRALSLGAHQLRDREFQNLQGVLEVLAEEQPEDFERLAFSQDILEFLEMGHLAD